jgi:hypothetical protein
MLITIPSQNTTFFAVKPVLKEPSNLSAPLYVKLPDWRILKIGSIRVPYVLKMMSGE